MNALLPGASMRRLIALAVGLVLSTLLLGGGWLLSTLRERETRIRESQEELLHTAGAVRGAIDESLEELRVREDARPFYVYNHLYIPPDVLAITDPVAVSPLAHAPRDPRLVGHFQIYPGGTVTTPYDIDGVPRPQLASRIDDVVSRSALPTLRDLAMGQAVGTMFVPSMPQPAAPPAIAVAQRVRRTRRMPDPEPVRADVSHTTESAGTPEGNNQLTLNFNQVTMTQAADIQAAQAGDQAANERLIGRGRQAPIINRRDVSWDELAQQQQQQQQQQSVDTNPPAQQQSPPPQPQAPPQPPRPRRVRPRPPAPTPAPVALHGQSFDNVAQYETAVDYTPMIYRQFGDTLLLYRVVSHEGGSVVQGVVFDRRELVAEWIPDLVRRHGGDVLPTVSTDPNERCAVRRPASGTVPGVSLCFAPNALTARAATIDEELRYQLGALIALLIVTLIAAWAIVSAARRAEGLSRQKSAFVSAVSHELRTPLTTLRMHAEMLEGGMVNDSRLPKVHGEMVRESVRLSRLIDNVLSLSKLEDGRRRLHPSEGDLRAHVREIVEGQRRFVEDRGFVLVAPEGGEPLTGRFDPQAVEQIVVNLLDNAVKYGGGAVKEVEVEVTARNGALRISVRDRGPGIPTKERTRVFDRFHRVERPEYAHAPGTGIGLALVKELAEAHGGRASVAPREGGGLEVKVELG